MMDYWRNLSGRERSLLGAMLALLLIFAIFFLGIRPVMASKTKAERAQINAQSDLKLVQDNLSLLSGAATSTTGTQPINRNGIYQMAQANGMEMSRFQPERGGAMKVTFDQVSSRQVFKFVSDTTATYAATVSAAQITRKDNGKVNVTITFRPLGS